MFFQEVLCYLEELNIPYICASIFDNLFDDDSQNKKTRQTGDQPGLPCSASWSQRERNKAPVPI